MNLIICVGLIFLAISICSSQLPPNHGKTIKKHPQEHLAKVWLEIYNQVDMKERRKNKQASWNYNTNITSENSRELIASNTEYALFKRRSYEGAMDFSWQDFSPKVRRQFAKITDIGTAVLPEENLNRLNVVGADMKGQYGTARVCNKPGDSSGTCYPSSDITQIMASSRDWVELEWAFEGWRNESARGMPDLYAEFVELQNNAAATNGYEDTGDYWRSWYEVDNLPDVMSKLWGQIKPLYQQLHTFVRKRLREAYPGRAFPASGHIPAHLLGNMWAQRWNNIEELLRPYPDKPSVDVTDELIRQGYNSTHMFRLSEEFFTSLGLKPMPEDFWKLSMLEKPTDGRKAVCYASSWDFFDQKDFRIKQCTEVNSEWLFITHHEMGHVEYFQEYKDQPTAFRDGANPGFHEAIGDVMELSVSTPAHLNKVGLLPDYTPDPELDMNSLMNLALRKIAFLPFGYLIDQWRWDVYRGAITRENYNSEWWKLRCNIQGVASPVPRSDARDFDPGAKIHVPYNVPYIRYFVSHVLQFQFHEALCKAAGHTGPLHQCSIYQSSEAGQLLREMMQVGSSVEWPTVLEKMTGSRDMEIRPLVEYFQPLLEWLTAENEGEQIGWTDECPNNNVN